MRISDPRYDRDRRRYDLALRMIRHQVRTRTISQWTGLSKYRIQTLFREYPGAHSAHRLRGVSPYQPTSLIRSIPLECESAALTFMILQMESVAFEALAKHPRELATWERGEMLVDAFDLYQLLNPDSRMTLEFAILLVTELDHHHVLGLHTCGTCQGLMVVDRLARPQIQCAFCRPSGRATPRPLAPAKRLTHQPTDFAAGEHGGGSGHPRGASVSLVGE